MRFVHRRMGPPLVPKPVISPSVERFLTTDPRGSDLFKGLDVGAPVVGQVAKVLDRGQVLMTFDGAELVATTTVPLEEGAQIKGIVQAKGPPLVVKLLGEDLSQGAKLFIRFRSLASRLLGARGEEPLVTIWETAHGGEGDWVEPLTRWLSTFALAEGDPPDPDRLRAALIHGGLSYEGKLWRGLAAGKGARFPEAEIDLKGVVLRLLGQMENNEKGAGRPSEKAVEILESLLAQIECFQTANRLAHEAGLGLIIPIPLRFGSHLRMADLLVGFPRGNPWKREGLRILLLLDMGVLGHFQIDTNLTRSGVEASIGVDRGETVALVRAMTDELRKALEGHRLTVIRIECVLLEKPLVRENFFRELLALDDGTTVSIRV